MSRRVARAVERWLVAGAPVWVFRRAPWWVWRAIERVGYPGEVGRS